MQLRNIEKENRRRDTFFILLLVLSGTFTSGFSDIIISPEGNEWRALYSTDPVSDIGNKGHEHLDIVGGTDPNGNVYDGGYIQLRPATVDNGLSEDLLFFRFRLDGKKNRMRGAFQVFFETDGDSEVEWVLQLTTSDLDTSGLLEFGKADGADRDGIRIDSPVWAGSYADHVNYTGTPAPDGSMFNGTDDYFLDLAVSWDTFSAYTGIDTVNAPFRTLMTTSQQGGKLLDGDVSGIAYSSDNIRFEEAYAAVPEPTVLALLAGSGLILILCRRIK